MTGRLRSPLVRRHAANLTIDVQSRPAAPRDTRRRHGGGRWASSQVEPGEERVGCWVTGGGSLARVTDASLDDDYWSEGRAAPEDEEILAISRAWLDYHRREDDTQWWACEAVMELDHEPTPERRDILWRLILTMGSLLEPDELAEICNVGAGPLEEFIRVYGDQALDLIEHQVTANRKLLLALAGVWGWSEPTWPRIDQILQANDQDLL
jgi:hypothetical protein